MDYNYSEEYFHQRLNELTDWMKNQLELAKVRDKLFIDLLRTKINQKTSRDNLIKKALRKAIITTQCELKTNNEHIEKIVSQAKDNINQFIHSLRNGDDDDDVEKTTLMLATENVQLTKVVNMCKERLEINMEKLQSIKSLVDKKRCENEQMRSNAAMAVSDARQNRHKTTI